MAKLFTIICKPIFFISILLILLNNTSGRRQNKDNLTSKIDSLIHTKTKRPFNGVIIISQNGKIKYSNSYGFSDLISKSPLKINNQFVIGSLSKQITAVLVHQELEQKRLSLDDPIKKYLPELKESWADSITIHHLLNHTSGIQSIDKPLAFRQGTQFEYSNLGYQLLGQIIEKTSGKTYSTLAKNLFVKCNMNSTTVPDLYKKGNIPKCYTEQPDDTIKEEKKLFEHLPAIPAGGIISTAKDLVVWNEHLHNRKVLTDSIYKIMITPSATRQHPIWGEVGYGYGIQIDHYDNLYEIGHSGYVSQGFTSINFYYPATKTSIIVLENIAWKDSDFNRAFFFEKEIRKIVRESNCVLETVIKN